MVTENRNIQRQRFNDTVQEKAVKIQIGARTKKIGSGWTAIDLYDKSDLIDHNWDLHDLPLDDNVVGCFFCNAILEHIYEPQLAIFEMYRTLEIGGHIWVEVPFNQFHHAHPLDFRRWTLQGIEWEMRRFERVKSGIAYDIAHEIPKIADCFRREAKLDINQDQVENLHALASSYSKRAKLLRLYSSVFFWGTKTSHEITSVERDFMRKLKAEVIAHAPAPS